MCSQAKPMNRIPFYETWHLGDHLWFVMFANRALAANPSLEIDFYSKPEYHAELQPFCADRLNLLDIDTRPADAIFTWPNQDLFWEHFPKPHAYEKLYLEWFGILAQKAGLANPFSGIRDIYWDDPEGSVVGEFDVLLVNSISISGCWPSPETFTALGCWLVAQGFKVVCTHPNTFGASSTLDSGLKLIELSALSRRAKRAIIGVANTPFLITLNKSNLDNPNLRWWGCSDDGSFAYDDRFHLIQTVEQLNAIEL